MTTEERELKSAEWRNENLSKNEIRSITCTDCNGWGWCLDHTPEHYMNQQDTDCSKYGCPVQIGCEKCNGTGSITVNIKTT